MAKGTYISINSAKIGDASAAANEIGRQYLDLYDHLKSLQKKLSASQNLLEDHYGICFDDAIPAQRLKDQRTTLSKIIEYLGTAAWLAQQNTNDLNQQTQSLQLAIHTMNYAGGTVYQAAIAAVSAVLGGETDCGDDYAYVGGWYTKQYTNSSKNWTATYNGKAEDYSDFNVVQGFNESFVLYQRDYYNGPVACTATSDAIVASIVTGQLHKPTKSYWSDGGCNWPNTSSISGTKNISVSEQCRIIAENVSVGNPVIFRVPNHSVVAVGLRNGVDPANATPSDILIIDPGDGKVKTADSIYNGWYEGTGNLKMYGNSGWSLRVYAGTYGTKTK